VPLREQERHEIATDVAARAENQPVAQR
jgi:hypothetical protein